MILLILFLLNKWNSIDDIRGACAVKGKVTVVGPVKLVDHGDDFDTLLFHKETLTGHYFI